ncbi:hypothetical protein [Paenibacillus pabuli]|uniref:hypothetical protein n=1 Tax=Paenibacillus pabuli TaxID=1472 RepID=UPI003F58CD16
MRELHGVLHSTILLKIAEKHSDEPIVRKLKDESLPKILMFITTGRYSRDAQAFANDFGMITMDEKQIAQALLSLEIGINRNMAGYWEIDTNALETWLNR